MYKLEQKRTNASITVSEKNGLIPHLKTIFYYKYMIYIQDLILLFSYYFFKVKKNIV